MCLGLHQAPGNTVGDKTTPYPASLQRSIRQERKEHSVGREKGKDGLRQSPLDLPVEGIECSSASKAGQTRQVQEQGSLPQAELGSTPAPPTALVVPPYASYLIQNNVPHVLSLSKSQLRWPVTLLRALLPNRRSGNGNGCLLSRARGDGHSASHPQEPLIHSSRGEGG